jgi:hypothetical protein
MAAANPRHRVRPALGTELAEAEGMTTTDDRTRAMHRGLRMAAKVAAVAGLLAAAGAPAQAAEADAGLAAAGERAGSAADLADRIRIGGAKGCGCAPCWGPPAPPPEGWA